MDEGAKNILEAIKVLDDAFKRGESCKTGLIAHLKNHKVPMANTTAVWLRKEGWVYNDKDKETGKMSYIAWNGPPASLTLATRIRQEVLKSRQKEKKELKKKKTHLDIKNEIAIHEAKLLELQDKIREEQIILNYLKSKL